MKRDRIVVITGAAGGMGALFVERFLANRDTVIATDTSEEALAKLAKKVDVRSKLHTTTADISDEARGYGDKASYTLAGCGHFMPEERPQFVIDHILKLSARMLKRSEPQEIAL